MSELKKTEEEIRWKKWILNPRVKWYFVSCHLSESWFNLCTIKTLNSNLIITRFFDFHPWCYPTIQYKRVRLMTCQTDLAFNYFLLNFFNMDFFLLINNYLKKTITYYNQIKKKGKTPKTKLKWNLHHKHFDHHLEINLNLNNTHPEIQILNVSFLAKRVGYGSVWQKEWSRSGKNECSTKDSTI